MIEWIQRSLDRQRNVAAARSARRAPDARSRSLWVAAALASLAGAVPIGCVGDSDQIPWELGTATGARSPFAPREMRITPLTHVENRAGEATSARPSAVKPRTLIVLHLEFVDRWYDTCKAIGKVELELYRPGGGLNPGVDVRTARWEIDLTNLDRNAEWFDPVTRTYRVQLDVPADIDRTKSWSLRVRAAYTPASGGGVLQDEFVLRE